MKSINTLEEDINHVLETGEGYTREIAEWVGDQIAQCLERQFNPDERKRGGGLRFSILGTPCERRLWYTVNLRDNSNHATPSLKNRFIFGDITEYHLLGLAKAAGHQVAGLQTEMDILGIKGHRDCVIDGMLIDVKSASTQSFKKFDRGEVRSNDDFGYISQLSSYLWASRNDPLVTYKTKAGFLAMDIQYGYIKLDVYDLTKELSQKEDEVKGKIETVKSKIPPPREFAPVPFNESGNMALDKPCHYCPFKFDCWDNLEPFEYSNKTVYFTKIVKPPKRRERKEEKDF